MTNNNPWQLTEQLADDSLALTELCCR